MTLFAVQGAAGTGKTYRLMDALAQVLAESPLSEGQKVLALTFMHGARRRLNDRLRGVGRLKNRFECVTIDSFAHKILRRWRTLAATVGIPNLLDDQFEERCAAAGALLERAEVRNWVAATFPILLVDEAQDLTSERLRMLCALAPAVRALIAADEFQCLNATLRPNPSVAWLNEVCQPEVLNVVRRTNVNALLAAASAVRAGQPPIVGNGLRIFAAQGVPVAAAYLANGIAWRNGGRVAVITPSLQGGFARTVIERVRGRACGSQGNGPYSIRWERSEHDEVLELTDQLGLNAISTLSDVVAALEGLPRSGPILESIRWVRHQSRTTGRTEFSREEIEKIIARLITSRRQRYGSDNYDFTAMTVQQAKNREFEGVFILWPYQVGGDAEHKRRLLYNALTRAKRWCTIVVQNPAILNVPPFR